MTAHRTTSVFAGSRFPPEVISAAIRWYLRYGLSYKDGEELPASLPRDYVPSDLATHLAASLLATPG